MVSIRFHLPILLSTYTFVNSTINYKFIRLCSICLIFLSQIISLSSADSNDHAMTIVHTFDEYFCQTQVTSCLFRKRYHQLHDNPQQTDNCRLLLILRLCLHHDTEIPRICNKTVLNGVRIHLRNETQRNCLSSSVYKNFYAQHLLSIAPSRTIIKCQIFVLLFFTYLIYH